MQVTMKLPLQSTTARQFKVFWDLKPLCVEVRRRHSYLSKRMWFHKKPLENGLCEIFGFIKEESEQDHTNPWTNSFSFMWKAAEYALPVLVCFWVPLFSFYDTFLFFVTKLFWKGISSWLCFCYLSRFRCWLNLSCRLSSFSNKNLILKCLVHLVFKPLYCS